MLGGGSNLVVADEGFAGTVVEVATRGIGRPRRRRRGVLRGRDRHGRRRRDLGPVRRAGRRAAAGSASRRCPASPAPSAPPRSRTSAPTARRSARPSRASGSGTASSAGCAPSPPPTAASATAPAASRPDPGRHVVLDVTFQLRLGDLGAPVAYAELARTLGSSSASGRPSSDVREAVLALRGGKGMVLDPADHDTWSAGSFFTNPVVDARGGARRCARLAAARRHRQDQRRLADRARRLRQGLRPGRRAGRCRCRPSTRWR